MGKANNPPLLNNQKGFLMREVIDHFEVEEIILFDRETLDVPPRLILPDIGFGHSINQKLKTFLFEIFQAMYCVFLSQYLYVRFLGRVASQLGSTGSQEFKQHPHL